MPKPNRERDENNSRRRRARGNQTPASWGDVDPNMMLKAVVAVADAGGAIRFGYTKGAGGFAIGFLGDGEPYTEYCRPSDDMTAYFQEVIDDWTDDNQPTPLRK